jgi:hypothetical protein
VLDAAKLCPITSTRQPSTHRLAKVVDQAARGQDVHSRQVFCTPRVVMVPMDGEDGQAHVQVGVLVVGNAGR